MSEARKYHLNLTVANQFVGQVEEEVKQAVFGNVGTLVAFRVGVTDANFLQHEFTPTFNETDLTNIEWYTSASLTISTIHSLCYSILKSSGRQPLKILSYYDHAAIVRLAARCVGVETNMRELAQIISQTKLGLLDHEEERGKLVCEYEKLKSQRLDYDDLLLLALDTLQLTENGAPQPSHIRVDEAQDLDPVQTQLIRRLAGCSSNVTFFFDHNQAIFSFKGACYEQIERLADIYPDTRKFYLVRNHRSSGKILDAANRLIQRNGSDNYSKPTRHSRDYANMGSRDK